MSTDLMDMMKEQRDYEQRVTHDYERASRNVTKAWDNPGYTEQERFADLQKISDYQAMREHMDPPVVDKGLQQNPGEFGYKVPDQNISCITGEGMDTCQTATSTVFHENQHNKQEQGLQGVKSVEGQFTEEQLEGFQKEYISPEQDYEAYYNHPMEIDARNAEQAWELQFAQDVDAIDRADQDLHFQGNQILETYDYPALEYAGMTQQDYNPESYQEEYTNLTEISDNSYDADMAGGDMGDSVDNDIAE